MRKISTFVKSGIHTPDYKHAATAKAVDIEEVDHYKKSAYISDFFDWIKAEPSQSNANGARHGCVMELYG